MATVITAPTKDSRRKTPGQDRLAGSVDPLSLIGNTPLLRLSRIAPEFEIYAKAEWTNPGGSVKDRAALNIIQEAEKAGLLDRRRILLDSTSGNTGIAYAMLGAVRGYRVKLCLPANASVERRRILKAYGAEVVLTDPLEGSDGALRKARELYAQNPDLYFYANQYNNPANWQAHYKSTGVEIYEQTQGRITHFVAGLGTSGTFTGTARRLREFNPRIRCISFQPDAAFHGLEGLKHMPSAIVPGIYDPKLADENLNIGTEETHAMARRLGREEGLLVGISSAAALVAALKVARYAPNAVVVTIFPDSGNRYLSETFWDEEK